MVWLDPSSRCKRPQTGLGRGWGNCVNLLLLPALLWPPRLQHCRCLGLWARDKSLTPSLCLSLCFSLSWSLLHSRSLLHSLPLLSLSVPPSLFSFLSHSPFLLPQSMSFLIFFLSAPLPLLSNFSPPFYLPPFLLYPFIIPLLLFFSGSLYFSISPSISVSVLMSRPVQGPQCLVLAVRMGKDGQLSEESKANVSQSLGCRMARG